MPANKNCRTIEMITIEIIPLSGIEIERIGRINLGFSKTAVEALLGRPSPSSNAAQLYYDNYELRIDLNKTGEVEFIEFINGPFPALTKLSIYGVDPFQVGADNLIALLSAGNNGAIDDSEAGFCYTFLNISVGIWRQMTSEDVEETIAEMKASGEYEENKRWLEEDLERSKQFWTIGIGVKDYYSQS